MNHWTAYRPTKERPWNAVRVAHLHRRAVFGLTAAELYRDVESTPEDSIQRILNGKGRQDAPEDFEQLSALIADAAANQSNSNHLKAWWIFRLLLSPDPLGERLTFMWHNHFATSQHKVRDLPLMRAQNDAFRRFARDEFGSLLLSMLQDGALLRWLDATTNRKGHANENLSRELMELFTLGVGNYTEDDVKNAARALTGLGIKNGRFHFDEKRFDETQKTILGQTKPFDAKSLAELLLSKPATSQRLADKLIAEFFAPNVVSLEARDELAEQLRSTSLHIGKATETILHSELFFSDTNINQRIADPLTFLIAPLRSLHVYKDRPSTLALADWLRKMGLDLFYPPNVAGWPGGRQWLSTRTVIARTNYVSSILSGDLHREAKPPALESIEETPREFARLMGIILLGDPSASTGKKAHHDIMKELLTGTNVHLH